MHSPTDLIHNDKDNISLLTFYGKLWTHEYNSDEGGKEGVCSFQAKTTCRTEIDAAKNMKHNSMKYICSMWTGINFTSDCVLVVLNIRTPPVSVKT